MDHVTTKIITDSRLSTRNSAICFNSDLNDLNLSKALSKTPTTMSGKQQKQQFVYSIATQYGLQILAVTLVHAYKFDMKTLWFILTLIYVALLFLALVIVHGWRKEWLPRNGSISEHVCAFHCAHVGVTESNKSHNWVAHNRWAQKSGRPERKQWNLHVSNHISLLWVCVNHLLGSNWLHGDTEKNSRNLTSAEQRHVSAGWSCRSEWKSRYDERNEGEKCRRKLKAWELIVRVNAQKTDASEKLETEYGGKGWE